MLYKIKKKLILNLSLILVFFFTFFISQQLFSKIPVSAQKLSIPAFIKTFDIKTKQYKVKRGDNLWMIAKRNKPSRKVATARMLSVIKLINKNSLVNGSALRAGMSLFLPVKTNDVYSILRQSENSIKFHSQNNQNNQNKQNKQNIINRALVIKSSNSNTAQKRNLNTKNQSMPKLISNNNKVLNAKDNSGSNSNKLSKQLAKKVNNSENNAWILLTGFFMFTSLFLYWRMQKLSKNSSGVQGDAARRLGVKSRSNNISDNSSGNLNNMHVSMSTRSEPKLNIQVNSDGHDNDSNNYGGSEDGFLNNNKLNDELSRIKIRIQTAPDSVDLRLDLLRKLVQLDDQEGFKKAVDELTPLLTEAHQTVWSDIRSMYFGKWAYDS